MTRVAIDTDVTETQLLRLMSFGRSTISDRRVADVIPPLQSQRNVAFLSVMYQCNVMSQEDSSVFFQYYVEHMNTNNPFFPRTIHLWNSLPNQRFPDH